MNKEIHFTHSNVAIFHLNLLFFGQILMNICRSFAKIPENDANCQYFTENRMISFKILEISGIPLFFHSVRRNDSIHSLGTVVRGWKRPHCANSSASSSPRRLLEDCEDKRLKGLLADCKCKRSFYQLDFSYVLI